MPEHSPLQESESRSRRPSVRWRLQWRYDLRWEPDVDLVTGMSGYGLREGLRIWWRLLRGTWRDDDPYDIDPREVEDPWAFNGLERDRP